MDAHVHLRQRATDPQPWIDPASMAAIDRDFTSDDLDRMLDATAVDAHPGVRFVLDHLGGIADTDDDAGWASSLRQLAVRPNTCAKISGLAATTVQELISGLSAAERLAIMSGTASTFYRINS